MSDHVPSHSLISIVEILKVLGLMHIYVVMAGFLMSDDCRQFL